MNSIFLSAIAGVTVATATVPVLAQNPSLHDTPVTVGSCSVVPSYDFLAGDNDVPVTDAGAGVWIVFENRSALMATDVTFLVSGRDGAMTVTDRGRFTSGIPIRHTLGPFSDLHGDESCGLYSVRFEDGSTWQRP